MANLFWPGSAMAIGRRWFVSQSTPQGSGDVCCFLIVLFLTISFLSFGQSSPFAGVKIASPTAASLGKMVDVPVNYHTGIPSITIPIHTAEDGPLKLPIALNYHAGGLKVMEQSSWVGAGWNLDCGGVITRVVRGNADDRSSTGTGQAYLRSNGYYNWLYENNELNYYRFITGQVDGEPDVYFFNVNGYQGQFYFRADYSVVLQPQQDVKIEPYFCRTADGITCDNGDEIVGWKLTTPDGTRYLFGMTDESSGTTPAAFERTRIIAMDNGFWGANWTSNPIASWYLRKVQSADQVHAIDLTYSTENYGYYSLALSTRIPSNANASSGLGVIKNLVSGVRLSKITIADGAIFFNVDDTNPRADLSAYSTGLTDLDNTEAKPLKQIRITGTGFNKTFEFGTTYFTDSDPLVGDYGMTPGVVSSKSLHTDAKRLKLDWIQQRSGGEVIPRYEFSYFNPESVPRTLSLAQDHWGFYNEAITNSGLIPSISLDNGATYSGGGATRDPLWPAMLAGTLSSIKNPMGGSTQFSFGPHKVRIQKQGTTWEDVIVGGLRIESITNTAPESKSLTQNFDYTAGGLQTGVLFSRPSYVAMIRNDRNQESGVPADIGATYPDNLFENGCKVYDRQPTYTKYVYAVSPGSVHPMLTSQGNHIGYNQVTVKQPDGGYTVYKYNPYTNQTGDVSIRVINERNCDPANPNFPPAPVPYDPQRGQLINVANYNAANNLLTDTKMQNDFSSQPAWVDGFLAVQVNSAYMATQYSLRTPKKTKSTTLEWIYDANNTTTLPVGKLTETFYSSSNHNLVSSVVTTSVHAPSISQTAIVNVVREEVLGEVRNTYVGDFALPKCYPTFSLDADFAAQVAGYYLVFLQTRGISQTIGFNQWFTAWNTYVKAVNNASITYVANRQTYFATAKTCMSSTTNYTAAVADVQRLIDLKNSFQLSTPIEISTWRKGGLVESTFTTFGFVDGDHKFTYPSQIEMIRPSVLSSTFAPVTFTNLSLIKDLRYDVLSKEMSLVYQKGGFLKEMIPRSGVVTSYLWDAGTKRLLAKAVGASNTALQAAHVAQGLTNIRNDAGLAKAMVTTYTYSPFIGLTSQTDITGLKTSYTYDLLGRLTLIKDNNGSIQKKIDYNYRVR